MKKTLLYVLVATITIAFLVPGLAMAAAKKVEEKCPEGKQGVTIIMPNGQSRVMCIPPSAVKALEKAPDNAATTIVTGTCPKDCWTSDTIAALTKEGTLTCAYDEYMFLCTLQVEKDIRKVLLMDIEDKAPICYTETNSGYKVSESEHEACMALLEPYHIPSLDVCGGKPCEIVPIKELVK